MTKRTTATGESLARTRTRYGLQAAIVVAVIVRLCSALLQGDQVEPLPGIHDQLSYDALARRAADGFGFSFAEAHWPATGAGEPTAHWSYLYTLFLSAIYAVFGEHPLVARIVQAVAAGVLQPWLTWRLAERAIGPRGALTAAWIAAGYGYFAYYGGALMTEAFFVTAVLWTLDRAYAIREKGRAAGVGDWVMLGAAIGVAALLRQVFLICAPFLVFWAWRFAGRPGESFVGSVRRNFFRAAAAAAATVCLLLPWTVRNALTFGEFTLLNTSAGFALYWGNHPVHGTEFIPILPSDEYAALIPDELLGLNEAAMEKALRARAFEFIAEDPLRFALLSASRAKEFFKFWPSAESSLASNAVRVGSFGLLAPLALIGMWTVRRRPALAEGGDPAMRALLWTFLGVHTAIHLLSWTLVRYRLPMDAVLTVFGALGAVWVFEALRGGRRGDAHAWSA